MADKRTSSEINRLFNEALSEISRENCTLFDHYDYTTKQLYVWPDEDWTDEISEKVKAILRETIHSKLLISCKETGRLSL